MLQHTLFQGHKIASRRAGAGKAVVLLHGFCESSSLWNRFVAALQAHYTVITIDLAGFGDSDMIAPYTIEQLADMVQTVVEDYGLEEYVLIGHSMGGYVATACLERHGARLRGVGLFHSHPFEDSEEKKKNRQKSIEFIQKHGVAPFVAHLFSSLFAPGFSAAQPAVVEDFIDQCSQQQSDAVIAASRAMMQRGDRSAVLRRAHCPVLFIIGEQDTSIPLSLCLQQTSLPDRAYIRILSEVGHLGMVEAEGEAVRAVEAFLEWCWGLD